MKIIGNSDTDTSADGELAEFQAAFQRAGTVNEFKDERAEVKDQRTANKFDILYTKMITGRADGTGTARDEIRQAGLGNAIESLESLKEALRNSGDVSAWEGRTLTHAFKGVANILWDTNNMARSEQVETNSPETNRLQQEVENRVDGIRKLLDGLGVSGETRDDIEKQLGRIIYAERAMNWAGPE